MLLSVTKQNIMVQFLDCSEESRLAYNFSRREIISISPNEIKLDVATHEQVNSVSIVLQYEFWINEEEVAKSVKFTVHASKEVCIVPRAATPATRPCHV